MFGFLDFYFSGAFLQGAVLDQHRFYVNVMRKRLGSDCHVVVQHDPVVVQHDS